MPRPFLNNSLNTYKTLINPPVPQNNRPEDEEQQNCEYQSYNRGDNAIHCNSLHVVDLNSETGPASLARLRVPFQGVAATTIRVTHFGFQAQTNCIEAL